MRIIDTGLLDQARMNSLSQTDKEWVYNGLDVCLTYEIDDALEQYMDPTSQHMYAISRALQAPILEMNMRGILIDVVERDKAVALLSADKARVDTNFDYLCQSIFGRLVNPSSPKQVIDLFYNWLAIPEQKKRNTKGEWVPTTDRDALEKIAKNYSTAKVFVSHILKSRDIGKQIASLETPLSDKGRFHTSLSIAGTKTGRLASALSDFADGSNLQNIDRRIKKMFIADPGKKFCNVDLEQADARNVGAQTWNLFPAYGDSGRFLDAAESGDLHTFVCSMCWTDLPWTGDPREDRKIADQPAYREKSYRDMAKILGHGCLTGDHEVLTPHGWVPISDKPVSILQWDNNESKFVTPSHWEDHLYTGTMQKFENHNISAVMTHDHRVPFKKDPASNYVYERPAEDGPGKFMPMGGGYIGGTEIVPARLIAAHMADGHTEVNWSAFHFHKSRKIKRLTELCDHYGYEWVQHGNKIRVKGNFPKYPGAFMLNWTRQCIKDFVDELKYWDGSVGKTAVAISSTRREDLEWYQTLGRLVGVGGNISKSYISGFDSVVYRLQQNNRSWMTGASVKHTSFPVTNLRVYCPTVPSGWFYVRRNGKIFVTGNTNFNGQAPQMAMHTKVERAFIEDFQHRYFNAFPEVKKRIEWIGEQLVREGYLVTLFGRRRYFLKRRGDNKTLNEGCAFDPQSMTADEINYAMIRVYQYLKPAFPWLELLIQVHDSLLFQYPEEHEDLIVPLILKCMQTIITLRGGRKFYVPSEAKVGWNWGDYTSQEDVDKAAAKGKHVDLNLNGMKKYKGTDTRVRL